MKNKNKSKLERIGFGFSSDELIKNPFSEYSDNFKIKLKSVCDLYGEISSVKLSVTPGLSLPVYRVSIEGSFNEVKDFLNDLTEKSLIPNIILPTASTFDKITDAPLNFMEYLSSGKKETYFYTIKPILNYYKEILKKKVILYIKEIGIIRLFNIKNKKDYP